MLSRQKLFDTNFDWVWQNGHTLANLGWMYLYDFYTIFRKCHFQYKLSKTVKKLGGHQVCLETAVQTQAIATITIEKNRKHDKEVRTGKEMSDFIIMLNFLHCRHYWEHISRSLCRTEMIIRLVLVITRKWKKKTTIPHTSVFMFFFCKSFGSHQKVMLRTSTLAESKDIHQPRQPGWDALGFVKYILLLHHKLIVKREKSIALGPSTQNLCSPWTVHGYSIKLLFSQCRCSCCISV